jgi:hypothetical protein
MAWSARGQRKYPVSALYMCAFMAAITCGCDRSTNSGVTSEDFFKTAESPKNPLAKFSGKVSIDGQPPRKDCKLFVILTDPKHLDENSRGMLPNYFAACDADGKFGFSTYIRHDGLSIRGKYVVTFVELHPYGRSGPTGGKALRGSPATHDAGARYGRPDELKNLYSDPDKNIKDPKFLLDLQPPGRDDYHFDLVVAGKEPIAHPAPHAVRTLAPRQLDWPPEARSAAK